MAASASERLWVLLLELGAGKRAIEQAMATVDSDEGRSLEKWLQSLYRERAKGCHPDVAPQGRGAEAQEAFVQLRATYEEALGLMEVGVRPLPSGRGAVQEQDIGGVRFHFDPDKWATREGRDLTAPPQAQALPSSGTSAASASTSTPGAGGRAAARAPGGVVRRPRRRPRS
eukprot:CAMPEP_0204147784 /NCGR_PEP_ID=MMETSP0361-20130328/23038_1 /ASSEMBLY_ACC=CAM_ASM_000343 /TAXON_ID=268821 /ORGANISM="Scrippsiella Hangoei, Strain SHTV-5" /LENGTH=171 /DNA_ID=CAMNT_0051102037 /DNA_START=8 /DNA_END=520 /DNA_ORIENTATION=+